MVVGAPLFADQLRHAGTDVVELPDHHIKMPAYLVEVGKYEGLEVDIGIVVPADFPLTPPSGPHIHKLIHQNRPDGTHPTGHIHSSNRHSKHFGSDWQYWSRPHPNWSSGAKNALRYMEHVRALWESQ